jgi:L,D-transpeptidase YcbB
VKWTFLLCILSFAGCSYFKTQPGAEPEKLTWSPSFDSTNLNRADSLTPVTHEFYKRNHFTMVWIDSGKLRPVADSMIQLVRTAGYYGLIPADYHLAQIDEALATTTSLTRDVLLDVYLTDSFFTMVFHLRHGRLHRKTLARFPLSKIKDAGNIHLLGRALSENSVRPALESQEPLHKEYHVLKAALKKSIAIKKADTLSQWHEKQLVVNMERWRWQTLPLRYITVNVPAFMMRVVEDDSVVLESNVIIGKPETPTPEIESVVRSFIIYPYWHVPKSIVKEILPHIQGDTTYLRKHNYDVLNSEGLVMNPRTIDWQSYEVEDFPYVLRQREGYENTMGVIKFVFNNNYGVYLHDTNARRLFSKADRALSHGCVRVQKAKALAHYLAKDDDTYVSPEDLDQYMMLRHRMEIKVVKPLPVLLQYFTCESSKEGVRFYQDLYGKDAALIATLSGQAVPVL